MSATMARKIKRMQPIIRIKQNQVESESAILEAIRAEKRRAVQKLREAQNAYMDGVEDLNRIRADRMRPNQANMEACLDHAKQQWYIINQQVQEIEGRERSQFAVVLAAEQELRGFEKLREQYATQYRKEMAKADQKRLDEMGTRRFAIQMQGERK